MLSARPRSASPIAASAPGRAGPGAAPVKPSQPRSPPGSLLPPPIARQRRARPAPLSPAASRPSQPAGLRGPMAASRSGKGGERSLGTGNGAGGRRRGRCSPPALRGGGAGAAAGLWGGSGLTDTAGSRGRCPAGSLPRVAQRPQARFGTGRGRRVPAGAAPVGLGPTRGLWRHRRCPRWCSGFRLWTGNQDCGLLWGGWKSSPGCQA